MPIEPPAPVCPNASAFGPSSALLPGRLSTLFMNPEAKRLRDGRSTTFGRLKCIWRRRTVIDRMTALGLTDKQVAMQMTAYSNWTGRPFQGFAYIKVTQKANAGSVTLLNNSPNPFNPVTKIKFAVEKAGNYAVKVYNVHGALVKTLANQNYDAGVHEVGWDGRNTAGLKAASGVYYAKIHSSTGDESNSIRLVLAK